MLTKSLTSSDLPNKEIETKKRITKMYINKRHMHSNEAILVKRQHTNRAEQKNERICICQMS